MLLWQGQLSGALQTRQAVAACQPRRGRHLQHGASSFIALGFLPLPEAMMIGYAAPLMVVALVGDHPSARPSASTAGRRRRSASSASSSSCGRASPFFEGAGTVEEAALLGAVLALVERLLLRLRRDLHPLDDADGIDRLDRPLLRAQRHRCSRCCLAAVRLDRADAARRRCFSSRSGLLGGIGQILMTTAYRHADAATIASFEYVSMLWGLAFGYLVLRRGADGERHRRRRDRRRRRHLHHLPRAPARPAAQAPAQGAAAAVLARRRQPP